MFENYNFGACIQYNNIKVPERYQVLAEILSDHHDEGEYFWLIQDLDSKNFYIIQGSHDYTGWDCQCSGGITEGFSDLAQLQLFVCEYDNQNRPVRQLILDQCKKKLNDIEFHKDVNKVINE